MIVLTYFILFEVIYGESYMLSLTMVFVLHCRVFHRIAHIDYKVTYIAYHAKYLHT